MSKNKILLADAVPAVGELRKVPGFDPLRLLQKTGDGEEKITLALRYKRLWFRLACPTGRLLLNPLRVTDQMAIYEAKVFLDKEDSLPIANYTVTKEKGGSGSHYIQDAQDEALEIALDNAGFGIQLCEVDTTMPSIQEEADSKPAQGAQETQKSVQPSGAPTAPVQMGGTAAPQGQDAKETSTPAQALAAPAAPVQADGVSAPLAQASKENPTPAQAPAAPAAPVQVADVPAPPVQDAQPLHEPSQLPGAALMQSDTNASIHIMMGGENAAEKTEPIEDDAQPKYTEDMQVEDILKMMTVEEAGKVVVTFGVCNGWTIEQVAAQRSASLKWYAYGADQAGNILKAAALVMLSDKEQQQAG